MKIAAKSLHLHASEAKKTKIPKKFQFNQRKKNGLTPHLLPKLRLHGNSIHIFVFFRRWLWRRFPAIESEKIRKSTRLLCQRVKLFPAHRRTHTQAIPAPTAALWTNAAEFRPFRMRHISAAIRTTAPHNHPSKLIRQESGFSCSNRMEIKIFHCRSPGGAPANGMAQMRAVVVRRPHPCRA